MSDVVRRFGYQPNGGVHRMFTAEITDLGWDTSHPVGRGRARGRRVPNGAAWALEDILVVNSMYTHGPRLRQRLIKAGLRKAECEECGLAERRGRPLALALGHINGIHTDNRLENLRILCPNCHALTDTWCARKPEPA
jgi:hypothetical protein